MTVAALFHDPLHCAATDGDGMAAAVAMTRTAVLRSGDFILILKLPRYWQTCSSRSSPPSIPVPARGHLPAHQPGLSAPSDARTPPREAVQRGAAAMAASITSHGDEKSGSWTSFPRHETAMILSPLSATISARAASFGPKALRNCPSSSPAEVFQTRTGTVLSSSATASSSPDGSNDAPSARGAATGKVSGGCAPPQAPSSQMPAAAPPVGLLPAIRVPPAEIAAHWLLCLRAWRLRNLFSRDRIPKRNP